MKDPFNNGAVFANNQLPQSRLSPQALTFLQFEPKANYSNGVFNFLSSRYSATSYQRNYTTRIDQNFSPEGYSHRPLYIQ